MLILTKYLVNLYIPNLNWYIVTVLIYDLLLYKFKIYLLRNILSKLEINLSVYDFTHNESGLKNILQLRGLSILELDIQ